MTISEALQPLSHVSIIHEDETKTICSVRITVMRNEQVDSGSMRFTHARYITFGQMVVFTSEDVDSDQCGGLFFKVESPEEAMEIIDNITHYITREKSAPDDCILIGE